MDTGLSTFSQLMDFSIFKIGGYMESMIASIGHRFVSIKTEKVHKNHIINDVRYHYFCTVGSLSNPDSSECDAVKFRSLCQ